jgi:hypothetical protein
MFRLTSNRFFTSSADLFVRGIPAICIVSGLLCLVIGYFALPKDDVAWRPFLVSTGQAILVGGVFAVILKTFQYVRIFKQEIADVIYSSEFLEKLGELRLREIWANVSTSLYNRRFPEISHHINQRILHDYLPVGHTYYYKKYCVTLDVCWGNRNDGIIKLTSFLEAEIIPYLKHELIECPFWFTGLDPDPNNDEEFKILELKVNGKNTVDQSVKEYGTDHLGRRTVKETYNLKLQGAGEYKINRKYSRLLDIRKDPVATFTLIVMCMSNRIIVRNGAADLFINFEQIGTPEKFNDFAPAVADGDIIKDLYKEYDGIMFPRQGYLLSFHEVGANRGLRASPRAQTERQQDRPGELAGTGPPAEDRARAAGRSS